MTIKEAYQVLGLPSGTGLTEIKKKYRTLMMQVHPDASIHIDAAHNTAQEINTAYALLKEKLSADTKKESHRTKGHKKQKQTTAWNSPVNKNAYREREVLQYVEDHDGTVIGNFCIARGKYMWTTDEDFSLFLLSLYQCSKQILDEIDTQCNREDTPPDRPSFQAELTYLLAQQFISQTALLKELAKEEKAGPDGQPVFYIPSMLEASGRPLSLKPGDELYPARISRHRLYLQNQAGLEAGYLSFADDRLYYIIVPLFEQKAVRIKIRVAEKQPGEKIKSRYHNLDLWIKLLDQICRQLPENLNLQIEQLLKKYQ